VPSPATAAGHISPAAGARAWSDRFASTLYPWAAPAITHGAMPRLSVLTRSRGHPGPVPEPPPDAYRYVAAGSWLRGVKPVQPHDCDRIEDVGACSGQVLEGTAACPGWAGCPHCVRVASKRGAAAAIADA